MSEQSVLDHASSQRDEVSGSVGRKLQVLISMANEAAIVLAQRRSAKARAATAASTRERRQTEREQRALYEADRLVWRRTTRPSFWTRATAEQVVRAWEACAPWASEFPEANAAMRNMAAEIRDRFDVQVDSLEMTGGDLALLLSSATTAQDEAALSTQEGAYEDAGATPLTTVSYRVRAAPHGDLIATETVHLGRGEGEGTAKLIAAEALIQAAGDQAEAVIDVLMGDDPRSQTEPLLTLDRDTADQTLREHRLIIDNGRDGDTRTAANEQQHKAVTNLDASQNDGRDGGLEVVAESLRFEQRTLRGRLRQIPSGDERDHVAERIADLGLRLRAVQADQRGENGAAVIWAAALRAGLDEDWWREATAAEIGALWEHAERWGKGAGRDQALDHLRAGLRRHHDVDLTREASLEEVTTVLDRALSNQHPATPMSTAPRPSPADPAAHRVPSTEVDQPGDLAEAISGKSDTDKVWDQAKAAAVEQDQTASQVYAQMEHSDDPDVVRAGHAARIASQSYSAPPSARLDRAEQSGTADNRAGQKREITPTPEPRSDSPSL